MNKELTPLEVLDELKSFLSMSLKFDGVDKLFIDGSLNIIEKSLKVLEIIKKYKLDVPWFIDRVKNGGMTWDKYYFANQFREDCMTQEEYDLLKEVLL